MKKLLNLVLCLALMVTSLTALTACNGKDDETDDKDLGFTYELVDPEEGDRYLKVTGYNVSDEVAELVSQGNFADKRVVDVSVLKIPTEKVEYKNESYMVKEIAESAFKDMLFVKKVVIPANVETVGSACLAGLTNLEELEINFVGNKASGNVNAKKTLAYLFGSSEVTGATSTTVSYNTSGTATYYVPDSLKKIVLTGNTVSEYAFNGLSNVEEIVLPETITEIGNYAFANCTSLYKLTLPATVTKLGNGAFNGCSLLTKLDLANVTYIGDSAFTGCAQLFYNVNGSEYIAAAGLKYVGENAFKGCTSLETVDLSAFTADACVGDYAFSGLTALTSVKLPTAANYGLLVFTGATKLEKTNVTGYNAANKLFDFDYDL